MKKYEIHTQNHKNGPLDHDYDLIQDDELHTLSYSNSRAWSEHIRGESVGALIDDGNGVIVTLDGLKKPIKLDYKQVMELQVLLLSSLQKDYITEIREVTTTLSYTGLR